MTSTTATKAAAPSADQGPQVDGSAYDLIKARLDEQARALGQRVDKLNARRLEVFGQSTLAVLSNERIRTENNCVPRDIINVGGKLFFAYNVFIGLRTTTRVEDVFALHHCKRQEDGTFLLDPMAIDGDGAPPETAFLRDPQFKKDFEEIYRYYKDATVSQLRMTESGRLLAVFQVGKTDRDVKVLRWAVSPQGDVRYIDARGNEDHRFPPTHSFEWTRATRDDYVTGKHPHVNILNEIFVETMGGDLTIKVENNTAVGRGIYSEPVDDKNQSLDDAQFYFARVGSLILLRILPFRESTWRHIVFNSRTKDCVRIDAIAGSCVELPEDHGIIFPGGFALTTGEVKTFDVDGAQSSTFYRALKSDNGEDVMYVFYDAKTGRRILLPYNLIDKEVSAPIVCHGWSLYDDGTLVAFRAESDEPTRLHPVRIWQTPFLSPEVSMQLRSTSKFQGSLLLKTGNPEAVRAISDVQTIRRMIGSSRPTLRNYEDLITQTVKVLDAYPWLADQDEAHDLRTTLTEVHKTSELVIDEFEKVLAIQAAAVEALRKAEEAQKAIFLDLRLDSFSSIDPFVQLMGRLRGQRGQLITLKEERYIDVARVEQLEKACAERFDEVTERAGRFLMGEGALAPYEKQHDEVMARAAEAARAADVATLVEELAQSTQGLQLLTEITGQLKIDDANARTAILEGIAAMLSKLNRGRAVLEAQRKKLLLSEGSSEFAAQMRLLGSGIESALSLCDTPERTDQELARLLVAIEELEGRFAEFSDFLVELTTKREEVFEVLNTRKQQLLDERNRRAQNLLASAERILDGVKRRTASMGTIDELNSAFAADPMVDKCRAIARDLLALGDSMKSEEVLARLKATREDATRTLRDKVDIYKGGGDLIQLGQHQFAVNKQTFDLTMLPRPGRDGATKLSLHLTGTEYFEDVEDDVMNELRDLWDDTLVSEDGSVARAEYLAASILFGALDAVPDAVSLEALELARLQDGGLLAVVANVARSRYDEGYERGVHDSDATAILDTLLNLRRQAGKLSHSPRARALAALFWAFLDDEDRGAITARVRGTARLLARFPDSVAARERVQALALSMAERLPTLTGDVVVLDDDDSRAAATALVDEIGHGAGEPELLLSSDAGLLCDELFGTLDKAGERDSFEADLKGLKDDVAEGLALALAWLRSVVDDVESTSPIGRARPALLEAAVHIITRGRVRRVVSASQSSLPVSGLFSAHPRIVDRVMDVRLDEVLPRLRRFASQRVPRFLRLKARRHEVIEERRRALRIAEFQPKVLSSFVRNRLINEVYLHLVGNNLAKQMGAAGDKKRADLMGMLLLISPPGYGKTTLMEYVAQRLGLFYVKVNGPSLGHSVTSLDPAEAPDATSRQEVEKLNFAFELGNNVLVLIDDIQHTSPEFLQKFISLCDGTRRVEGVWRGKTRTYDLRGKRFVVCMAGNPYTETGDKFRIPDMLANRADTYNLGDITGGRGDLFALSFVENALTANTTTQPLAGREPADVHLLLRLAQGEPVATTDLKHGYSGAEIDEIVRVMKMLLQVQSVLIKVNATYIQSAAVDERFRTEPPFKLQGSYRNMAKLAAGVVSVMTPDELERLVDDHYRGESQTLTSGAEANLLKLAELRGRLTPEQAARWADIRKNFERLQLQGDSNDPATRVAGTLATLTQRVEGIASSINDAAQAQLASAQHSHEAAAQHRADDLSRQDAMALRTADAIQQAATALHTAWRQTSTEGTRGMQTALGQLEKALSLAMSSTMPSAIGASLSSSLAQTMSQALTPPLTTVATELDRMRSESLAWQQAKEQARVKERSIDERRADERARAYHASDPAMLTALERVTSALGEMQVGITVENPPPQGITDLVRLQTVLIEASLLPLVKGLASSIEHEKENASRLEAALEALKALEQRGIAATPVTASPNYRPFKAKVQGTRIDEPKKP
jgi:hypothetical protein